ncbi:MAG: diguanylate cyclase domain-containing protein [Anaerovoracaceae bacterium]
MKKERNSKTAAYDVEKMLKKAFESLPIVLFAKNDECKYTFSSCVEDLLDSGEEHSILNKTDIEVQFDPELGKTYYEQDKRILQTGESYRFISEFRQDENKFYREISKHAVLDEHGTPVGISGIVTDVTELVKLREKFQQMSLIDSLTGVYNRNYVIEYDFDDEMYLPCTYIVCDCDDLKKVNDEYGHDKGDEFIKSIAETMSSVVGNKGIVVRWGGDEFLAILPKCDENECGAIVGLLERKLRDLKNRLAYAGGTLGWMVRKSIKETETQIIDMADARMYANKHRKKNASEYECLDELETLKVEKWSLVEFLQTAFRDMPETLFVKDAEAKYIFSTQECFALNTGASGSILGKTDLEVQREKNLGERYYMEDMEILKTGKSYSTIDAVSLREGIKYVEVKRNAIRSEDGEIIGICGVCSDVTELVSCRKKFEKLSLYDSMTYAYSRHYTSKFDFENPAVMPCGYIMCDCNGLKKVNDELGHLKGDEYICQTADIMRAALPERAVLVRWGGDEFMAFVPNSSEKEQEEIVRKINKIQKKERNKYPYISIAVGSMLRHSADISEDRIFKLVDEKMYEDKVKKKAEGI